MDNRLYRADCKLIGDNLIEEGIQVDLIYLDPPFKSNRTYSMIFNHGGTTAQQKAYHDMWDFTESTRQLVLSFREELQHWELPQSFKEFMNAWMNILEQGGANDKKLLNYLMYITQRLVRLKKLLKPTGSIYFHCDPTASHYVKVLMDGIFGRDGFRNEIIWGYKTGGVPNIKRAFASKHDCILFYARGDENKFNHLKEISYVQTVPDPNTPSGKRLGVKQDLIGKYREVKMRDWWVHYGVNPDADIPSLFRNNPERRGYDTQKPLKLLNRIIAASSHRGDTVLDPFCGCGTTLEAAYRLGRKWIGIDISGDAIDETKDRMKELGLVEGKEYALIEGNPDTMREYNRLNPYEKQEWLIRRLGGLPNPKKSGDRGLDGDMSFHKGTDKNGRDILGKVVFSVKTGKQKSPAHIRELKGTMQDFNGDIGVLILDVSPTSKMERDAQKSGQLKYQIEEDLPPKYYDKVQIITASEIIEGGQIECPPSMHKVREYRKTQLGLDLRHGPRVEE